MNPSNPSEPVLSICVPTFNRARYLDSLLADLSANIGELGHSYELLIGDNASADNTAEVVRKYEAKLAIRYVRRLENVGAHRNISQLFGAARGKYLVYVADDDLLLPGPLGHHVAYLEANPDVGVVFAPWITHDRVAGEDFGLFYAVERETRIDTGDHGTLFDFLVNGHIFPEIYVARTEVAREVVGEANPFAYIFFVQIAAMLDRAAITFSPEPFYRQVIRYFADESRAQFGHEEVKFAWDRYRGGLEYILAKVAHRLDEHNLAWCQRAIDQFTRARMQVALRLRTAEGGNWVDNYYIANRLRCVGNDSLLSAPYDFYRINAAFEYLLGLQPFYPRPAVVAYYLDDPPKILSQARDFAAANLVVLTDHSLPLLDTTILLTSREPAGQGAAFSVSEAELLARFP